MAEQVAENRYCVIVYSHPRHEALGMGKSQRFGRPDGMAHVACRQAACASRTASYGDSHRPSAQGSGRRIGGDRCESIQRRPEADLERQLGRLAAYASRERLTVIVGVRDRIRLERPPIEDCASEVIAGCGHTRRP